jgi:hypothetical protein
LEAVVMEVNNIANAREVPNGNAIQHCVTLTRSPLLLSPVVEAFFTEITPFSKNLLMGYLVLPIVLYPPSRDFLRNANSRSSVRSFCADRNRLAGLPQRVAELRITTSLAMQHAIDCGRLILHSDLSLEYAKQPTGANPGMPHEIKAAKRLASIFESYDVLTMYRLLGVTNL